MRARRILSIALGAAGAVAGFALGRATTDRTLFEAPRGAWLATVRGDASLTWLEERDGWRRVRIEGWTAADSSDRGAGGPPGGSGPATPLPRPAPGAGTAQPAPSPAAGSAVVRGVLYAEPGDPAAGSAIVLLIADLDRLESAHAAAGARCKERVREADVVLEKLRDESERALQSSDNFREAAARNDAVKARIARAEADRVERIRACRREADAIFIQRAAARTVADPGGSFEFDGVARGRYRIFASTSDARAPRAWLFDARVEGPGTVIVDSRADRAPIDPYWDLRE